MLSEQNQWKSERQIKEDWLTELEEDEFLSARTVILVNRPDRYEREMSFGSLS